MSGTRNVASAVMAAAVLVAAVVWPDQAVHSQSKIESELAAPGARGEPVEEAASASAIPSALMSAPSPSGGDINPTVVRKIAVSKSKRSQLATEDTLGSLHRMQAPFPDHNVIVCVGGCPRGKETIVFFKKRIEHVAIATGSPLGALRPRSPALIEVASSSGVEPAVADASGAAAQPAEAPIACVAGCYGAKKTFNGRRAIDIPETVGSTEGTWLTGVNNASSNASPPVVTRYSRSKGVRKDKSSDWFTKQF